MADDCRFARVKDIPCAEREPEKSTNTGGRCDGCGKRIEYAAASVPPEPPTLSGEARSQSPASMEVSATPPDSVVPPEPPTLSDETRERRGHKIDQRFISDVRRAYNLRGGETDAWVVQRIGNAIAELNAQRTTLGDPPGPHLIQSASVPPEPPTLSDGEDYLLRVANYSRNSEDRRLAKSALDTVAALRAEVAALSKRLDSEAVSRVTSAARAYAEYTVQDESEAAAIFSACDALLGVGAARSASGEDRTRGSSG